MLNYSILQYYYETGIKTFQHLPSFQEAEGSNEWQNQLSRFLRGPGWYCGGHQGAASVTRESPPPPPVPRVDWVVPPTLFHRIRWVARPPLTLSWVGRPQGEYIKRGQISFFCVSVESLVFLLCDWLMFSFVHPSLDAVKCANLLVTASRLSV